MVVSGRITATVGFVVDAVSVTLRSVALSLVGPAFVAAGGGLVSLSLRHLDGFSSAKNGASGSGSGWAFSSVCRRTTSWACCS